MTMEEFICECNCCCEDECDEIDCVCKEQETCEDNICCGEGCTCGEG